MRAREPASFWREKCDSRRHSVTDFSENVEVTEILKFSTVEGLTLKWKKKKQKNSVNISGKKSSN